MMMNVANIFVPIRRLIIELIQITGMADIISGYKKQISKDFAHTSVVQISVHSPPDEIETTNPVINIKNVTKRIANIPLLNQCGLMFKNLNIIFFDNKFIFHAINIAYL